MIDLPNLSIRKAHDAFLKKEFTVRDLVTAYRSEIEKKDGEIHAYLEIFDDALLEADRAQERIEGGDAHILTGIPIAVKDNILIKGKHASAGSKILENFTSPYDATAITKLKDAGAIFLGRTNMDEFAMGSSTENSAYGPTKNPLDLTRVPGGSSGGSIAAVAGDMALGSLGSETGGSVRQPASFCGVVGLKPTYGAISRSGLIALGSSLDQIGPVGKSVDDTEIIFKAIRGTDPLDSTSFYKEGELKQPKVIGVPRHFLSIGGIHPDVLSNFEESLEKLSKLGFEIKDIELPNAKYSLAAYYVVMPAEASSNLARFDGMKYGFQADGANLLEVYQKTRGRGFRKEPRRRIMLGAYVLSSGYYDAYYSQASGVRSIIRQEFEESFKTVDLIATPTSPTPAFKLGEKVNDPLSMYLADIFTVPANIASICAISLPSGFSKTDDGKMLPLGLQFMAGAFQEDQLFYAGKKFLGEI
jgi:aspartyl-tRNA(Asn)/glutamyl-tRNA(Gln) amidotransferase subunit A